MRASARISRSDSTLSRMPAAIAWASSASLLPGPAKLICAGGHAGVERHLQLAAGGDVDAVDQAGHVLHQRRHRVGLHRVVQLDLAAGRCARSWAHALRQQRAVVGVERRAADALRQAGQRHAADLQAVVDDGELRFMGACCGRGCVHGVLTSVRMYSA